MRRRRATVMVAVALLWSLTSCAQGPERYLKAHVGNVSQDEVQAQLGKPDHIQSLENGGSKWVYIHHVSYATYLTYANRDSETCYRYDLIFDAQKILRTWSEETYDCGAIN